MRRDRAPGSTLARASLHHGAIPEQRALLTAARNRAGAPRAAIGIATCSSSRAAILRRVIGDDDLPRRLRWLWSRVCRALPDSGPLVHWQEEVGDAPSFFVFVFHFGRVFRLRGVHRWLWSHRARRRRLDRRPDRDRRSQRWGRGNDRGLGRGQRFDGRRSRNRRIQHRLQHGGLQPASVLRHGVHRAVRLLSVCRGQHHEQLRVHWRLLRADYRGRRRCGRLPLQRQNLRRGRELSGKRRVQHVQLRVHGNVDLHRSGVPDVRSGRGAVSEEVLLHRSDAMHGDRLLVSREHHVLLECMRLRMHAGSDLSRLVQLHAWAGRSGMQPAADPDAVPVFGNRVLVPDSKTERPRRGFSRNWPGPLPECGRSPKLPAIAHRSAR